MNYLTILIIVLSLVAGVILFLLILQLVLI